jgi:hypothetical protein
VICPNCPKSKLVADASGRLCCKQCGLRRHPDDTVIVREDTHFRFLKRNVNRTPSGSKVKIEQCGQMVTSIYGIAKADVHDIHYTLKSAEVDRCIAFSHDMEDLALFAVENNWWFDGPDDLIELTASLRS